MPSIQDVADQINAKLDSINNNTSTTAANTGAIKTAVNQTNAKLTTLDANVQAGFANLSQGLFVLSELEKIQIAFAEHNSKQNDTIICLLENSNEVLCGITRKFTRQLELSEAMLNSLHRIEGIEERVHADAAGDYDRHLAIHERMEECCPHDEPEPEPCPEACAKSEFRPPKPPRSDWKPLPNPGRQTKPADGIR